ARLVDYLIREGAHGVAAVGGASEGHKLTVAERKWLAERTIELGDGRVPTIVGTSATCTRDAVDLTRHAESLGAVRLFCPPPVYGTVTREALDAHYGALAQATSLPILLQDAQVTVAPAEIARLGAASLQLRWVKEEAADSGHRISELKRICGTGVNIMSGG